MIRRRKKNSQGKIKHKNKTVDGIKFDSITESEFYVFLKKAKADGKIKDFELQPKFLLQDKFIIVNNEVIEGNDKRFNKLKRQTKAETIRAINYIADFRIELNDRTLIIDVKGIKTADFKLKEKMFTHKYPQYEFMCVVKYKNQWLEYNHAEQLKKGKVKK